MCKLYYFNQCSYFMFSVCFNKLTSVYPSKTNHYSVHLFIINRIYRFGILLIFHFYPFPFRKKKGGGSNNFWNYYFRSGWVRLYWGSESWKQYHGLVSYPQGWGIGKKYHHIIEIFLKNKEMGGGGICAQLLFFVLITFFYSILIFLHTDRQKSCGIKIFVIHKN